MAVAVGSSFESMPHTSRVVLLVLLQQQLIVRVHTSLGDYTLRHWNNLRKCIELERKRRGIIERFGVNQCFKNKTIAMYCLRENYLRNVDKSDNDVLPPMRRFRYS